MFVVEWHQDSVGVQDGRSLFVATALVLEFGVLVKDWNRLVRVVLSKMKRELDDLALACECAFDSDEQLTSE